MGENKHFFETNSLLFDKDREEKMTDVCAQSICSKLPSCDVSANRKAVEESVSSEEREKKQHINSISK